MKLAPVFVFVMSCLLFMLSGCVNTQAVKGVSGGLSQVDQQSVREVFGSQKRIAVLVGINNFDDTNWHQLSYAVKDAQDMAAVLNDDRYGAFDKVIALTGRAETSKEKVLGALAELKHLNVSSQDTIVFYISTHGTLARTRDGKLHQYLVVRDTRFDDIPNTAIDVDQLKAAIGDLPSQKKVIIFASCHSGKGKSQLNGNMIAELKRLKAPFFVKPIEKASEAMIVLAASAWGEAAREDSFLKNDIYTHFFIEGIKKHDINGDGAVTVSEAHDYAKEQTYYLTKGEQRPSMESVILGADPVILAGKVVRSGKPVLYDYSHNYEDMVVLVDGEKKGTLPLGVALEPGTHHVELASSDDESPMYSETFQASRGERIALPLLLQGYENGASLRVGYHGYLTDEINRSVAKPMPMLGVAYSEYDYFSPQLGYRADFSYGQANQTLDVGFVEAKAKVSQISTGVALVFRHGVGGTSLYGGPRLGALRIDREIDLPNSSKENTMSPTVGAIMGAHFKYKKSLSMAIEGAFNYASIDLRNTNAGALDYSLYGSLSLNF